MRLYIITKRNLISIGFCLLIGVLAGAIAVTSTVRAVQSAAAQREIPIYYVDTDKKQVALSFDAAWGNEQTEHLLEILDKYKVKSTFFLVGDWVKNYPDSVKDIAKHGHDVGNHSNTHPHMTQMSSSDMVGQIQSCNEKIKELTGKTPTLFRAPYGDYNNDVVKSVNGCNMYCVQWDVDSLDWKDPTPEQIKQNIMKKISEISGAKYHEDAKKDVSLRIITDHVRSATFMIGDGVIPSNNGRGYVLRRLIRRACRHGRLLGVNEPFLYKVCDTVIHENHVAYPELADKAELITKVIRAEEDSFGKTIDAGLAMLDEYINKLDGNVFSGEDAFKLNDTYGFPLDLTKDILEEKGITVDEDKFNALLAAQKATARAARKDAGADAWKGNSVKIDADKTEFVGYTDFDCDAKILAIVNADGELVDMLGAGESGTVVLDKTPFYAQSGGQVGDSGVIKNGEDNAFIVADTAKNADSVYLHKGEVSRGIISVGDSVFASINAARRKSIMRNHTAAHLLQAALRQVLGTHVEQAGQLVNETEVRFDFTHFNPMTTQEIAKVEMLVNKFILSASSVTMQEMPIEEAKKMGAMMLFGEKYGDIVRVVKAGDFSTEFCGGTHVANSGEIGLFKIVSEASVAAGVRRITAYTGLASLAYLNLNEMAVKTVASILKTSENEVVERTQAVISDNKEMEKEIQALNAEITKLKSADMFSKPTLVDGLELYIAKIEGTTPDALRSMGDDLKNKGDNVVALIAGVNGDKANLVAVCGKNAIAKGVKAGDLVREIAKLAGGGGGGRPDSAMAGAKDISKLDDALAAVEQTVKSLIK